MAKQPATTTTSPSVSTTTATATPTTPRTSPSKNDRQEQWKDDAQSAVREATDEAVESIDKATHRFKSHATEAASQQKEKVAHEVGAVGTAIHSAAEKLRDEGDERLARYVDIAAEQLDDAARYVKTKDFNSLYADVERLAKRRPELFLGGMLLAGIGISRFLKASRENEPIAKSSSPYTS